MKKVQKPHKSHKLRSASKRDTDEAEVEDEEEPSW
jgi:hypothetical protein